MELVEHMLTKVNVSKSLIHSSETKVHLQIDTIFNTWKKQKMMQMMQMLQKTLTLLLTAPCMNSITVLLKLLATKEINCFRTTETFIKF
jgi:hypothetical protein